MHRGAPANSATRYIRLRSCGANWEEPGGWGESVAGQCRAAHQRSRLLEDSFLLGAGAKNCANLGAVHFGLGSGLYRAFDLGADLVELAADVVERSPILELGDQQDIWLVRSTRLDHDDTIARNEPG